MDSQENICFICYDELNCKTKCILMECGHSFCKECIHKLVTPNNENLELGTEERFTMKCPLDRKIIKSIEYVDRLSQSGIVKSIHQVIISVFEDWHAGVNQPFLVDIVNTLSFIDKMKTIFPLISRKINLLNDIINEGRYDDMRTISREGDLKQIILETITPFEAKSVASRKDIFDILAGYKLYFLAPERLKESTDVLKTIYYSMNLEDQFKETHHLCIQKCNVIISLNKIIRDILSKNLSIQDKNDHSNEQVSHYFTNLNTLNDKLVVLKDHFTVTTSYSVLLKALLLTRCKDLSIQQFYFDSKEHCILCREALVTNKSLQLGECGHSVCGVCQDKFSIPRVNCVFQCNGTDETAAPALSASSCGTVKQRYIDCAKGIVLLVAERYEEVLELDRHLSARAIYIGFTMLIKDDAVPERKLSELKARVMKCCQSMSLVGQETSYDLMERRYKLATLAAADFSLVKEFGDPSDFVYPVTPIYDNRQLKIDVIDAVVRAAEAGDINTEKLLCDMQLKSYEYRQLVDGYFRGITYSDVWQFRHNQDRLKRVLKTFIELFFERPPCFYSSGSGCVPVSYDVAVLLLHRGPGQRLRSSVVVPRVE